MYKSSEIIRKNYFALQIEDLHVKIGEMASGHASDLLAAAASGKDGGKSFDIDLLNEERARVKKLRESQKKLSERLEGAEKELRDLKEQNLEDLEREQFASFEALEKAGNLEEKLASNKIKIIKLRKALDEANSKFRYRSLTYGGKAILPWALLRSKFSLNLKKNHPKSQMASSVEMLLKRFFWISLKFWSNIAFNLLKIFF